MKSAAYLTCLTMLSSIGWASPLAAADGKAPVSVNRSANLKLAPGGTVRVDRTWGDVTIEGWDKPVVEVAMTATSARSYDEAEAADARARLEKFGFDAKATSAKEVVVTGVSPSASLLQPFGGKSGVKMRYSIKVPRNSSLVMRNEVGTVEVSDLTGSVNVESDVGDVHVKVPLGPGAAVEASTRVGEVSVNAEARAKGELRRRALVGHSFSYRPSAPDKRVTVHLDVGTVTID